MELDEEADATHAVGAHNRDQVSVSTTGKRRSIQPRVWRTPQGALQPRRLLGDAAVEVLECGV